jgi:uncharacterized protein
MSGEFLGSGWQFPLRPDQSGQMTRSTAEECIHQAIWLILATAPGERVMCPDFGCGIHDLVFGANSAATAGQVSNLVHQALTRWEPRIDLLRVEAGPDPAEPNLLLIEIDYRVRTTNNRFNLVYPFYLE